MIFFGSSLLQQKTFEAEPAAYAHAKFNVILQSKMEVYEGTDNKNFFSRQPYRFDSAFMTTIEALPLGRKSAIEASPAIAIVNGHLKVRLKSMDPILFYMIGNGRSDIWSPESAFRSHLFYPLYQRSFLQSNEGWMSRRLVNTTLSTIKMEPSGTVQGIECLKFSHKFSSTYGNARFDLFETIWLRKVDNSTQRMEWDIRQSGTDQVINVKRLKMFVWRNR